MKVNETLTIFLRPCMCLFIVLEICSSPYLCGDARAETVKVLTEAEILDVLEILMPTHKANVEKIETWQGELRIQEVNHYYGEKAVKWYKGRLNAHPDTRDELLTLDESSIPHHFRRKVNMTVPFAIDMIGDKLYSNSKIIEAKYLEADTDNELPIKSYVVESRSIVTPVNFLDFWPEVKFGASRTLVTDGVSAGRAAFIRPVEKAKNQQWSGVRDPRRYLGDDSPVWEEYVPLLSLLRNGHQIPMVGEHPRCKMESVKEKGHLKYVITWSSGFGDNIYIHKEISLNGDEGFCPTSVRVFDTTGKLHYSKTWTYEVIDGVFLPKTLRRETMGSEGISFISVVTFEESVINKPIPDDVFTYRNLGLKNGDRVIDEIRELEFTFKDGELVPASFAHLADEILLDQLDAMFTELRESGEFPTYKIFIPESDIALEQGKPFILDLVNRKLRNFRRKLDTEEAYDFLMKMDKGDIAWDEVIVTTRKALVYTVRQEVSRPLEAKLGIWSNSYKLPENVKTPYTLLAVTKEGTPYLITIVEIKTDGIEIVYRKLNVAEAKMYMVEFPHNAVEARAIKEANDVIVDKADAAVTSSPSENSVSTVASSGLLKVAIVIGFSGCCVAGTLIWIWRKRQVLNS